MAQGLSAPQQEETPEAKSRRAALKAVKAYFAGLRNDGSTLLQAAIATRYLGRHNGVVTPDVLAYALLAAQAEAVDRTDRSSDMAFALDETAAEIDSILTRLGAGIERQSAEMDELLSRLRKTTIAA